MPDCIKIKKLKYTIGRRYKITADIFIQQGTMRIEAECNEEDVTPTMIKPEEDLELSIKALRVYPIEPAIIESMLSNLRKIVNNKTKKGKE